MKVRKLYEKYVVPQNLGEHMLRVASLADILLDHWRGPHVDKKAIRENTAYGSKSDLPSFKSKD